MKKKRPNIVFLLSDQHNAKVLGCKGHPDVKTPNLDRMASEGVTFDNAVTQNPICTPSRVCWLSGQYCHNHGYYGLSGPNPGGLPTILGHFRKNGYRTAAIGKIHCPEYWVEDDSDFFREAVGNSIDGNPYYADYLKGKGLLAYEDHIGLQEFGDKGKQSLDARKSGLSYEDSPEGWSVRQGIGFMKDSVDRAQPFLLHLSFPKPHQCYTPSEPFWSMYDEENLSLPPNADYAMRRKAPHLIRQAQIHRNAEWAMFEPRTFEAARRRKLHGYLGNVSHVDHSVGEIVRWLDENALSEDTLVIYSSDHGDYACEHGIMEKAPGICSDAITRIPFLWRWPGNFKAGHAAREIVETVDLANTLCSLAGLELMQTSDGRDISHLLRGEKGEVHRIGVTEFAWSKSVRKGRFRYVYYPVAMFAEEYPEGFGELYDMEADPWEMENLYFDRKYSGIVREMKDELFEFMVTSTRPRTLWPPFEAEGGQAVRRYHNVVNPDMKINTDVLKSLAMKNYL